jgi:glycosyltransferase involved in cell wall biosynthesis
MAALARALDRPEVSLTVLTTASGEVGESRLVRLVDRTNVVSIKRSLQPYKIAWGAVPWLRRNINNFDIVHIHAVFSFLSVAAAIAAYRKNVPYIVRPLGVLNRWGMLKRRPMAKRFSYTLIESRILKRSGLVHFTSEREAEETYEGDPTLRLVPAAILPIPVEIPLAEQKKEALGERSYNRGNRMRILFMSRFTPQKGLELLMRAFAKVKDSYPDWVLVCAGGGDSEYLQKLHDLAHQLAIYQKIIWTGYLSGTEKWSALLTANLFVLPSYSESFGIAAAEALVSGCPSILSDQIPFAGDAANARGARIVKCEIDSLTDALLCLCGDANERQTLSVNGRQFAQKRFSPEAIGTRLLELYSLIISTPKSLP